MSRVLMYAIVAAVALALASTTAVQVQLYDRHLFDNLNQKLNKVFNP